MNYPNGDSIHKGIRNNFYKTKESELFVSVFILNYFKRETIQ